MAQEGDDTVLVIISNQPGKSGRFMVKAMQWRQIAVELIEIANQQLHAAMVRDVEQKPVQFLVMIPFRLLGELDSHENHLFTRMAPHEGKIGTHGSETAPVITRHSSKNGSFAMHHFVMR